MPFQFIHEESYSRKAGKGKQGGHSIATILAEAARKPGAHPHVTEPKPPTVIYGCSLAEVEQAANEYAEGMLDAKGRKLRSDAVILLAGVASCPASFTQEQWEDLRTLTVEALSERYGDRLRSVIEHTDEAHPHIHYYVIPRPGERYDQVHLGRGAKAKAEAKAKADGLDAKGISKAGNIAYCDERREFQRWYHSRVSSRLGLTLMGPRRRRLSRKEWMAEQSSAEATAQARADAAQEVVKAAVEKAQAQEVIKQADQVKAVAIAEQRKSAEQAATVQKQQAKVVRAQKAVAVERKQLQQDQERWRTWGGRVGAAFGWMLDAVTGRTRKLKRELQQKEKAHEEAMQKAKKEASIQTREEVNAATSRVRRERDLAREDARRYRSETEQRERQERLAAHIAARPSRPVSR